MGNIIIEIITRSHKQNKNTEEWMVLLRIKANEYINKEKDRTYSYSMGFALLLLLQLSGLGS